VKRWRGGGHEAQNCHDLPVCSCYQFSPGCPVLSVVVPAPGAEMTGMALLFVAAFYLGYGVLCWWQSDKMNTKSKNEWLKALAVSCWIACASALCYVLQEVLK